MWQDLKAATNDFAEESLLGKGSHGLVYKGVLKDGKQIAVKRATYARQRLQDESSFDNELEILSKIWSERLVNLLGYTREADEKLLVVEFMPNGTLHDNLHDSFSPLSWSMRVQLSLQTAKGILTLHSASPPIIHRDIKSSNVLIDENWNAKLGDFGLALRGHIEEMLKTSTPPAGTMGYLDPEYETPSDLSTKTDVFSFGILLLEVISGRNAIDLAYEPPSILDWALPLIKQGKIDEVCDKKVPLPANFKPLKQMINLAMKCVRTSRYRRPTMFDVVEDLKDIHRRITLSSFDNITRVVRRSVSAQRPWPGAPARRAKVPSSVHHTRLLSQVSRFAEAEPIRAADSKQDQQPPSQSLQAGGEGGGALEGLMISNLPRPCASETLMPIVTETGEIEAEASFEEYKSANASFRSNSTAQSMDLDEDMCEHDALSSANWLRVYSARPKPKLGGGAGKKPLSPCISPEVSHELGRNNNISEAMDGNVDFSSDPLYEITEVRDLCTSQYDLIEHPVSRSSSCRDVQGNQARLIELQNAQLKAMNEVFQRRTTTAAAVGTVEGVARDVGIACPSTVEEEGLGLSNEDTGVARRTAYVAIKALAGTCIGAALRPCVRMKGEDDLPPTYLVGT